MSVRILSPILLGIDGKRLELQPGDTLPELPEQQLAELVAAGAVALDSPPSPPSGEGRGEAENKTKPRKGSKTEE